MSKGVDTRTPFAGVSKSAEFSLCPGLCSLGHSSVSPLELPQVLQGRCARGCTLSLRPQLGPFPCRRDSLLGAGRGPAAALPLGTPGRFLTAPLSPLVSSTGLLSL